MAKNRLLPVRGAVPKPGEDISGTEWQRLMKPGETALFCLDATGRLLKMNGEVPENPISEYCVAFKSRFRAQLTARGAAVSHPHVSCALYDKRGRWLATYWNGGSRLRNEGLRLAWVLLQFPITAILGLGIIATIEVLSSLYYHEAVMQWQLDKNSVPAFIFVGLLVGGIVRGALHMARLEWIHRDLGPALARPGSPEREKFYKKLNRHNLLVPEEIKPKAAEVQWPQPEKHEAWARVLHDQGFTRVGQYTISEAGADMDLWLHAENGLTAAVSYVKSRQMWLAAWTQYPDGSSFTIANKTSSGVDPHPQRKVIDIGPDQPAEEVLRQALALRPSGEYLRFKPEDVIPNYIRRWKEYMEWRRQRGTTIDEFRRIDAQRVARMEKQV